MSQSADFSHADIAAALVGLALMPRDAPGDRPDLRELDFWRRGELPPARAAEVWSHICRDPLLHAEWSQLQAVRRWLSRTELAALSDQDTALLALALDQQTAPGERPDLLELDLWRQQQLPAERAAEVAAWVARDSATHAALKELVDAEQWLEQADETPAEQPAAVVKGPGLLERIRSWFEPSAWLFGGGAAAFATVAFLAFMLTPLLMSPDMNELLDDGYAQWRGDQMLVAADWPWQSDRVTKGKGVWVDPVNAERRQALAAFANGIRTGLARLDVKRADWQEVLQALPERQPVCGADDRACEQRRQLLRQAGLWGTLIFQQCRQESVDGVFWRQQARMPALMKKRLRGLNIHPQFVAYINTWAVAGDEHRQRLCGAVEGFLALAY